MEVVLSLARTFPRSTARLLTRLAGLVRFSFQLSLLPCQGFSLTHCLTLAKSLVAGGLARRLLVQLSYAIGVAEPLSIYVDSYGTGKRSDEELVEIIRDNWDLRPGVIGEFNQVKVYFLLTLALVRQL